ncbi:MAG: hypothetical protein JWM56_1422 [Candidatus Peribacteria bacterium]|nr:hypothetical protein [Candidatus Peribacteria bacterium]
MRKVSLLLGTLGGALGAYLLSNKPLRDEMMKAKDGEAAAKALGKHLQKDSKMFVKEVKTFVESDDVQKNLQQAKKYTTEKMNEAKKGVKDMMNKSTSKMGVMMKKETKAATKAVNKVVKKVTPKKSAARQGKEAAKTAVVQSPTM